MPTQLTKPKIITTTIVQQKITQIYLDFENQQIEVHIGDYNGDHIKQETSTYFIKMFSDMGDLENTELLDQIADKARMLARNAGQYGEGIEVP